jgi:hypothetical protein
MFPNELAAVHRYIRRRVGRDAADDVAAVRERARIDYL